MIIAVESGATAGSLTIGLLSADNSHIGVFWERPTTSASRGAPDARAMSTAVIRSFCTMQKLAPQSRNISACSSADNMRFSGTFAAPTIAIAISAIT